MYTTQGNGVINELYSTVNNLQLNKWHHVAFTQSVSTATFYIDGQITFQAACNPPTNVIRDSNTFGASFSFTWKVDTEFDDVKIYNRSLSQEEIKKVLNSYY